MSNSRESEDDAPVKSNDIPVALVPESGEYHRERPWSKSEVPAARGRLGWRSVIALVLMVAGMLGSVSLSVSDPGPLATLGFGAAIGVALSEVLLNPVWWVAAIATILARKERSDIHYWLFASTGVAVGLGVLL